MESLGGISRESLPVSMTRLERAEVQLHRPLPFALHDESGRMLLRRGFVIESAAQLDRLIDSGLYLRSGDGATMEPDPASAHAQMATVRITVLARLAALQSALEGLLMHPQPGQFEHQVLALAQDIQTCFQWDADAAIASVQVMRTGRYSVRRMIHAAVLAELLLAHAGEAAPRRRGTLAAALTMNMTMLDVQDQLYAQRKPPDDAQRALVRSHPAGAVKALRELGVRDERWLATVAQHHETVDGNGYPQGLAGTQLGRDAQVLSLVDRYGSMAIGRAYRAAVLPNLVLRQIFLDRQSVDPKLAALLVGAVGMYPPGSLVALASGELAMVVRRSALASQPLVHCLTSADGKPLARPRRRLTSEPAHAISRLIPESELPIAPDPDLLWDESFEFGARPSITAQSS